MRDSKCVKTIRIAAGILALTVVLFVLSSALCIAVEAGHDCAGEDCQICACIEQCEQVLRHIGDGLVVLAAVLLPAMASAAAVVIAARFVPCATPVSQKVRMND